MSAEPRSIRNTALMDCRDLSKMDYIEIVKLQVSHIPPAQIEKETVAMMRRYHKQPRKHLAVAVAENLIGLLAHPGFKPGVQIRCNYRELASQWRIIAGL